MARDAPTPAPRSASPTKRRLANSSTPSAPVAWAVQPQFPTRSPAKPSRTTFVPRATGPTPRESGLAEDPVLLDAIADAFGAVSIHASPKSTPRKGSSLKSNAAPPSRAAPAVAAAVEENVDDAIPDEPSLVPETGSPTNATHIDTGDTIPPEESTVPAASMYEEPSSPLTQTTITNDRAVTKPLFLESESESDDYVPLARPPPSRKPQPPSAKAKAVPRNAKAKVVGRRIASDSDSESDAPAAITPVRPPEILRTGQSSSAEPRSASNQARRTAVIDLSSDEDEPVPLPVSDTNVSAPGPSRKPPLFPSGDDSSSDNGVLTFSRIPASPSKRIPSNSSTGPPINVLLAHGDSDSSESDEDEVHRMLSGAPSPPKRRNKRLSVWSTKEATEIIPISSSSDTESDHEPSSSQLSRPGPAPKSRLLPPVKKPAILATKTQPKRADSVSSSTTTTTKRGLSKKAMHEHLVRYANDLYTSLNQRVFGDRLPRLRRAGEDSSDPDTCEIVWSNTLKKTAGRAVISRTSSKVAGKETTTIRKVFIELATKVVDSEERIRHTLSHEMCHLAVWVIDQVKENDHGPSFKSWASRVMRARKDIEITTRHSYTITYKFEWECVDCSQIYGRHSKSIRTSEQRCGRCKGELKPCFEDKEAKATGWTLFVKEQMGPMLASRKGISRGDAMKEIGKLWRARGGESVGDGELGSMISGLGGLSVED